MACSVTGMLWTTCGFLEGGMDTVFPDESSQLRGESMINLIHEVIAKIMLFLNQSSRLSLAPVIPRDLYIHNLFFILHLHNRGVPRCRNL